jgi:hypothetical protein
MNRRASWISLVLAALTLPRTLETVAAEADLSRAEAEAALRSLWHERQTQLKEERGAEMRERSSR